MYTLGLDIGSSSVKACLYDAVNRTIVGSSTSPADEMPIASPEPGWAEQEPSLWWHHVLAACDDLRIHHPREWATVGAIGIAYQMHGLVALDSTGEPVRPSIIWCDSRAVDVGKRITDEIGRDRLLNNNLNTAGNFTASKGVWMMEQEPERWSRVHKVMLPGDFIAYQLTGVMATSNSGLSEMALWDFAHNDMDRLILNDFPSLASKLPDRVPSIGVSATLLHAVALRLGLRQDVVVSYRSGDQPNNAFGLGVVHPGSVAMNAGTSGVVYAVTDRPVVDTAEVFNPFIHVNDGEASRRIGLLLCLNGCGILNAQMRRLTKASDYNTMNLEAGGVPVGSDGLRILPFGNGAERMLSNRNPGASITGWDLVRHTDAHFYRASLEGIAAALAFGIEHMRGLGVTIDTVHAGRANLFLSSVFCETITAMAEVEVHLYDSDGASAAAKGAAYGAGYISPFTEPAALLQAPEVYKATASLTQSMLPVKARYFEDIRSIINT